MMMLAGAGLTHSTDCARRPLEALGAGGWTDSFQGSGMEHLGLLGLLPSPTVDFALHTPLAAASVSSGCWWIVVVLVIGRAVYSRLLSRFVVIVLVDVTLSLFHLPVTVVVVPFN